MTYLLSGSVRFSTIQSDSVSANHKQVDTGNLVIKINDKIIENVEKTKFLGVIINSKLKWNDHIQIISNKISKNCGYHFQNMQQPKPQYIIMLYISIIQPYLDYCNIVWATGGLYLDHLFKKQKKAIRVIIFSKWNAHYDPFLSYLRF